MPDREKRRVEYLAKAKEAKEIAWKFMDKESREQWERIAEAHLGPAETT
jgi:23S rRNA A1618 N6-methylase RlmF